MIKIRRNCKRNEGRSLGVKRSSKARKNPWSAKFRSLKGAPAKSLLGCEIISQPQEAYCEIRPPLRNRLSQPHAPPLQNAPLAHECHFAAASIISQLRNAL